MPKKIKISFIIFIVIGLTAILSLFFLYNPLQYNFFPKCPIYSFTGTYCPGCGSQRAIHQLLNGNIVEGFKHNFLILLLLIVIVYDTIIRYSSIFFRKTFKNLLHKPVTTISILIIVIIYWILRNINHYPFTILAP